MDVLTGLLDGPRATNAFLLRAVLSPPWSIRIEDEAPVSVFAVVRGSAWVRADDEPPVPLAVGDAVITVGPTPYVVADEPANAPQVVIGPGQVCRTPGGQYLGETMRLGVRTWGNDPDGETALLVGSYGADGEIGARLLQALPPIVVLRAHEVGGSLVELLVAEVAKDGPGQEVILDRLLDLLLITMLRAWLARADASAPAWYVAYDDPIVGRPLRLMHHQPAHPWTVARLAAEARVSRATFARRFTDVVGQAPMTFLTEWRLAVAADLLRDPDVTLVSVARQVGYSTPFALSTAFSRVRGMSPSEYRRAVA